MEKEELEELLSQLRDAGMDAQLCDVPVHMSSVPVRCGYPTEIGDDDMSEYVLLPKSLLGLYPEVMVPVQGDSMCDVGFEDGDELRIQLGIAYHDGDNVLALVDGRATVKTLFTDMEGMKWLVPQNEKYDAIPLTEDMDFRISGVVVGVAKAAPRPSTRDLQQAVRRTKNKNKAAQKLTDNEVDLCLIHIGDEVMHARQWYAVFRMMVDHKVLEFSELQDFVDRVWRLLPDHKHLPVAKELSRMGVQSFAKPVALWVEDNAPVKGARFRDYLRIALLTDSLLVDGKEH